jgi:hypothetical protein
MELGVPYDVICMGVCEPSLLYTHEYDGYSTTDTPHRTIML